MSDAQTQIPLEPTTREIAIEWPRPAQGGTTPRPRPSLAPTWYGLPTLQRLQR